MTLNINRRLLSLDPLNFTGKRPRRHLHRLCTLLELCMRGHVSLIKQLDLVLMVINFIIHMLR